jgi:hypothetical protein
VVPIVLQLLQGNLNLGANDRFSVGAGGKSPGVLRLPKQWQNDQLCLDEAQVLLFHKEA